jgi:hypothetical protein
MSVAGQFTIHHVTGAFAVSIGITPVSNGNTHEAESALFFLRHAFNNRHSAVVEPIERWHAARFGGGMTARFSSPFVRTGNAFGASAGSGEQARMQAWDAFERAVRSGDLALRRVQYEPALVVQPGAPAAPTNPTQSDETPTHFEATLVDEIGEPIAGLPLILSCEGKTYDLTTTDAGVVRKDGLTASRASLRVASVERLKELVAPRWSKQRNGELPRAKNALYSELSDELQSFPPPQIRNT